MPIYCLFWVIWFLIKTTKTKRKIVSFIIYFDLLLYNFFFSYLLLYPSLQLVSFNLDFNLYSQLKKGSWGFMFSNPRPLFSSAFGVSDKYPLKKRIYWPKLFSKCHATRQALITQWLVPQMTFWSPVIDRAGNSRYICIFPSKIGQFLGEIGFAPPLQVSLIHPWGTLII